MSQSDFTDAFPFHSEFRARTNEIGICGRLHPGRCHRFFREGGLLIFPRFSAGCFPFSDEGGSIYRDRNPFLLRLQIERLLQSPNLGSGCGVKGIPSAGAMAVSSLNLISRSFRMSHQCRDRFDSIVLLIRFSGSSRSCIFRFSLFPIADYFLCEISFLRFHPQIQKEHSEGLVNYRGCGGGGGDEGDRAGGGGGAVDVGGGLSFAGQRYQAETGGCVGITSRRKNRRTLFPRQKTKAPGDGGFPSQ